MWDNLLNKQINNLQNDNLQNDKKKEKSKEEYTNLYNYLTRFILY